MKEKILNVFATLGFKLEKIGDDGYIFYYEGRGIFYNTYNNDDTFFHFIISIFDAKDEDEINFLNNIEVYKIMNKINTNLKFIKAFTTDDNLCLSYEREIVGDENFEELIPKMILGLNNAINYVNDILDDIENNKGED